VRTALATDDHHFPLLIQRADFLHFEASKGKDEANGGPVIEHAGRAIDAQGLYAD